MVKTARPSASSETLRDRHMIRGLLLFALVVFCGCDSDRMARLEKKNQELEAKLAKQQQVADLDAQSKCAAGARTYFNDNWASSRTDPDTQLLNYHSHYNRRSGICLVVVEFHYRLDKNKTSNWANIITVYDAFEGFQHGRLSAKHLMSYKDPIGITIDVTECALDGEKCTTEKEFHDKLKPLMNE